MSRRLVLHSLGPVILSSSLFCLGATTAFAQRDNEAPPEPPRPQDGLRDDEDRSPQRGEDQDSRAGRQPRREFDEAARLPQRDREGFRDEGRGQADGRFSDERGARRGRGLGITFDEGEEQLLIREVEPGSPAAQAGLRAQDRIISVNGRELNDRRRFSALISGMAGRRVPIQIERNGRQYTVQFTPREGDDGPWLGVYLQDSEEAGRGEQGAVVTHVYPAGPAARAGLRPGDVIVAVDEQEVQDAPELIAALDRFEPRDRVTLRLRRGDQEVELAATLAQRSQFFYQTSMEERSGERGQQRFDEDDPFSNIPPHAMELEHHRRMAEQHERLEREILKLQDEVRQLREAIERR